MEMLAKDGGPVPIRTGRGDEGATDIVRRLNKERAERQAKVLRRRARDAQEEAMLEEAIKKEKEKAEFEPTVATDAEPLDPERAAIKDLKSRYLDIFDLKGSEAIRDMTVVEYLAAFKDDALVS